MRTASRPTRKVGWCHNQRVQAVEGRYPGTNQRVLSKVLEHRRTVEVAVKQAKSALIATKKVNLRAYAGLQQKRDELQRKRGRRCEVHPTYYWTSWSVCEDHFQDWERERWLRLVREIRWVGVYECIMYEKWLLIGTPVAVTCHHHCYAWLIRWQSRWMLLVLLHPLRTFRIENSITRYQSTVTQWSKLW